MQIPLVWTEKNRPCRHPALNKFDPTQKLSEGQKDEFVAVREHVVFAQTWHDSFHSVKSEVQCLVNLEG